MAVLSEFDYSDYFLVFVGNLKLNNSWCGNSRASASVMIVEIVGLVTPLSILLNWEYSISAILASSRIPNSFPRRRLRR